MNSLQKLKKQNIKLNINIFGQKMVTSVVILYRSLQVPI